jgi:ATP-binding cassette, subfamily B, bacterial RamB/AmfA
MGTAMRERVLGRPGTRLLLDALRRGRVAYAPLAGWSLVESMPALLSGKLIALALDQGFLAGRPTTGIGWLVALAAAMVIGAAGARQVYGRLALIVEPLRDELTRIVVAGALHRGVTGRDRSDASGVARLTRQVEAVRDVVAGLLLTLRHFAFTALVTVIGLLTLAPPLVGLVAIPLLAALAVLAWLLRVLGPRQRALLITDERLAHAAGTVIGGMRDVTACGAEQQALSDVAVHIDEQARAAKAVALTGSLRTVVVAVGGHLPVLLVLATAPWFVRHRYLTAGSVVGAVTYLALNLEPTLRSLVQTVGSAMLRLSVVLDRLAETGPRPAAPPVPQTTTVPATFDLQLCRVQFAYGRTAAPIVKDLDLTVAHGEHLAIVGPSGIGKSTVAELMLGLAVPQRGQVSIGGKGLTEIPESVLRRCTTLVPQHPYVFEGSLRENLTYLRPVATGRILQEAVEALGLLPLVRRLGGYDAALGRGTLLSNGERQLVALVRTYLSGAEIVILDEASSHLDMAAAARVEWAFKARHGTLIVIAHRMDSARRADRVLFIAGSGHLIGTYNDLRERSPAYARLARFWEPATGTSQGKTTAMEKTR